MALANKVIYQNGAIKKFEKPEVCEAIKVANANRWTVALSPTEWDQREARLKDEYEKNTKAPGPGEEQLEEKKRIICCNASPKADFYYKHVLNEGNPALKESASQFNDALLNEQVREIESLRDKCKKYAYVLDSVEDKLRKLKAENSRIKNSDLNLEGLIYATRELEEKNKKIEELTKEKTNLEDQITILNACKEHNENVGRKQIKRLGKEVSKLNSIIHDKNAVLADVAEELRLTKIREKNLAELGLKYVGENEKLKKELADKVVDKIDAQALKSAESALAWKEKVVTYKDMGLAYYEKKIAEKDEVISDLGNELAATKKELEEKTQLVEIVRNASKEYCEYGVAANEFIKKLANLYVIAGNKGTISNEMFERCKNYQTYGFPAKFKKETKKEINDIARGKESKKPRIPTPEEPKHDKSFEDFVNRTIDNYNRRAANFGWIGSKDGNGIIDQMVGADLADEGADLSGIFVLCGKDFIDALKNVKDVWQE